MLRLIEKIRMKKAIKKTEKETEKFNKLLQQAIFNKEFKDSNYGDY